MNLFEALTLGVIQGATEFLPISSSGHLILIRDVFGFGTEYDLAIDAVLQLATILAVLIYFRKEIYGLALSFLKFISGKQKDEKEKNLLLAVIVGTLPAVVVGLTLESKMETVFRSSFLVAVSLLIGSLIMFLADRYHKNKSELDKDFYSLDLKKGLKIGLFQALAVIPGMSRSGATISGGLLSNLSRESSARFSFILSFPIIFGSGIKKFFELSSEGIIFSLSWPFLLSFIVSFLVGILAIHFLIKFLKNHSLNIFIFYRVCIAIAVLVFI